MPQLYYRDFFGVARVKWYGYSVNKPLLATGILEDSARG